MKLIPLERIQKIDRRDDTFMPIFTFYGSMGSRVILAPTWEQIKILSNFHVTQILGLPMYYIRLKGLTNG